MGYSMEVMQRARARLAAAKADRESENQQHLAQAYEKYPACGKSTVSFG